MSKQSDEIARVRTKIGDRILDFARFRLDTKPVFNAEELHEYVSEDEKVAPASADRILRDLRQKGRLDYRVVNRRKSEYEVLSFSP